MRQQWDLRSPLIPGDSYVAHARIEDIYKRRGRTVVVTAMTLKDADGQVVVRSDHHQSFLLDQPDGEVELRDPTK